ncbi:MAG: hypothetical protein HY591_02190 [Candidatus Omnitrophica bacterium]|nr:hypothetical protein [Candidatus Omnitrophota bacterium]
MNQTFDIPYKDLVIPARGSFARRIISRPMVHTVLSYQKSDLDFSFPAIVDSGADYCVFPASYGELLGLDIYKGPHLQSGGLGGGDTLYFHKITVKVILGSEPVQFDCEAGFSRKMDRAAIGFLGRHGFFELFEEVTFYQRQKRFVLRACDELDFGDQP